MPKRNYTMYPLICPMCGAERETSNKSHYEQDPQPLCRVCNGKQTMGKGIFATCLIDGHIVREHVKCRGCGQLFGPGHTLQGAYRDGYCQDCYETRQLQARLRERKEIEDESL